MMKEIKAFVRPDKVDEIIRHLKEKGFDNLTVSTAEGTGKFQGNNNFVPQKFAETDNKVAKLELVAEKEDVEAIVWIISDYGRTDNPGDGIIYVSDVLRAIRVKTGDDAFLK